MVTTLDSTDTGTRVFIRSSCEDVFGLIIDTSRHGEYVQGYVDQVSGPRTLSKGSEYIWRIILYGAEFRVYSYVSAMHPPNMYQESMHIPGLFRAIFTDMLEEVPGGMIFTCTWRFMPISWSASGLLAQKLMNGGSIFRDSAMETIAGMKRVLEGGTGEPLGG
jgi:hypothetical protein